MSCEHCDDGRFEVTECPKQYASSVVSIVEFSDLMDEGILPIAGGALDQCQNFLKLHRMYRGEVSRAENLDVPR